MASLVEDYGLPLRKRGHSMVGLCPFHVEKTPSFTVFPDTQHFKCFGCQMAGDVFTFVMEREGWGFREAFEWLAERAGISVDGVFRDGGPNRVKVDVHGVLGQVREWLQTQLLAPVGEAARAYLEARGLTAAIEPFGIGFQPPGPSLARFARDRRLPLPVLEQAGLLQRSGREPFAGRVMFPIEDERGRVVGFGGRVLGDTEPKYINSPESPFFNKRRLLFGLRRVKQAGVRRIVVMEGYTDVIACQLAGFQGAVATLGTALTVEHARLLERYATEGAVLLFDGDQAGRRAAARAFEEVQNSRLELRIALAGEGYDPADMVAPRAGRTAAEVEAGRGQLRELLDSADDTTTVWFRLLRERVDLSQAVQVERAAAECGRILKGIDNQLRREALLADMARHLGVAPGNLSRMVGRVRHAPAKPEPVAPAVIPAPSPAMSAEIELLACLLARPSLRDAIGDPALDHEVSRELYQVLRDGVDGGHETRETLVPYAFSRLAERRELADILGRCVDRSVKINDPREFLDTLQMGRRRHQKRRQAQGTRRLLQEALSAGDQQRADELTRRYVEELRHEKPDPTTPAPPP